MRQPLPASRHSCTARPHLRCLPVILAATLVAGARVSAQEPPPRIEDLRAELVELRARVERLEAALQALDGDRQPAAQPSAATAPAAPAVNTPPPLPPSDAARFAKVAPRIDLLMQTRYDQFTDPTRIDTFRLRKAEVGIKGHVSAGVDFSVELDPVRSDDPFRRTYLRLIPHPRLHVKLGLEKSPLGLEELTSSAVIPFVDRAAVTHRFAPAEELGLHVESRWTHWLFQAAITNGNRRASLDDDESKALTGRVVWAPRHWISAGTALARNTGDGASGERYNAELKLGTNLSGVQAEMFRVNGAGLWSTAYYLAAYHAIPLRRWGATRVQPVLRYEAVHAGNRRAADELAVITSGVSLLFDAHRSKLQFNHLRDVRTDGAADELRAQYQIEF